jgi:WD40 repeat protein
MPSRYGLPLTALCLGFAVGLGESAADDKESALVTAAPSVLLRSKLRMDGMAFSPDGKLLTLVEEEANPDFEVSAIDVQTKKTLYRGLSLACGTSIRFTPHSSRLVCLRGLGGLKQTDRASIRTQVDVYEAKTGKLLRTIILPPGWPGTIWGVNLRAPYAVSDDVVVIPWEKGGATVYDLKTGKSRGDLAAGRRLEYISLSRDGRWLLALEKKRHLSLWDVKARKLQRELHDHDRNVVAISMSADGNYCASILPGAHCYLFNRKTGRLEAQTETWGAPHDLDVGGALTADGSRLVIRMEESWLSGNRPTPAWKKELDQRKDLTRSFLWTWDWKTGKPPRPLALIGDDKAKDSWEDMGQFEPELMTADGSRFVSYPRYGNREGVLLLQLKDKKRPAVKKP